MGLIDQPVEQYRNPEDQDRNNADLAEPHPPSRMTGGLDTFGALS